MSEQSTSKGPTGAQRAANRANAQLSTGPRTKEGKQRSSKNAIKHGLTAEKHLLPDEKPEEFDQFAIGLWDDLAPVGSFEQLLAKRAISLAWRLQRAVRAETGLLTHLMEEADTESRLGTAEITRAVDPFEPVRLGRTLLRAARAENPLLLLMRYEVEHHSAFVKTIQMLDSRQKARQATGLQPADDA